MPVLIPTRPPHAHQLAARKKAEGQRSFFLLAEMGTGKSKTVWDTVLQGWLDGALDRVLVVAGKGSYSDWHHKHIPENTPKNISVASHLWRGGHSKIEQQNLRILMDPDDYLGLPILIMNVEAFGVSKRAQEVADRFVNNRTFLICDESTKIRNVDASRTKFMIKLGQKAKYRWAMTGLVTPRSPLDLWGQMSFLGLSHVLGTNWYTFRARYCNLLPMEIRAKGFGGKMRKIVKIVGFRDLDVLTEKIAPHSFRVLKKDCLDLPAKIYEQVEVELTEEQKKSYASMAKNALAKLENGVFASAATAMTILTRLHQICCGFLVDEDGKLHDLPSTRMLTLSDIIEEMEGKIAIWCAYQHDVRSVSEWLRTQHEDRGSVVEYYGPTSTTDRAEGVRAFQDGDAGFFVGTAATGGFGITLTSCSNVIYFSNSFDLEHRLQSEDRFHRIGQNKAVTYVDMVAPKTVEVKILRALIAKKGVADLIMDGSIHDWLEMPG